VVNELPPFAVEPDNPAVRARFVARCGRRHGLTPMQATVLYALLRGVTCDADLADDLCLAEQTVRNHLTAIYEALGVHCATGAVYRAWPRYLKAGEDIHLLRLGEALRAHRSGHALGP
jgi:DNA-binding NarL/FixJ family response regulator